MSKVREGNQYNIKGSVITLTKNKTGNCWYYDCSKCSEDIEMFPEFSLHATVEKGNVKISCLCARTPRLTEDQNRILVKRECDRRGVLFLGWEGEYKGKSKTPVLISRDGGSALMVRSILIFLAGGGPREEQGEAIKKAKDKGLDHFINLFLSTGSFVEGTIFKKSSTRGSTGRFENWDVYCPTCANDEYSKANVGDGWFTSAYARLKAGQNPCRCKPNQALTEDQMTLKLKAILDSESCKYIRLEPGKKVSASRLIWECSVGHENSTTLNNFLRGRRCGKSCKYLTSAKVNPFGLYEGREQDDDNLYLIKLSDENEEFIKVGRSFNTKSRFSAIGRHYSIQVLKILQDSHTNVLEKEAYLVANLKHLHYSPKTPFKGSMFECLKASALDSPILKGIFEI